jgi:hypothetical protein
MTSTHPLIERAVIGRIECSVSVCRRPKPPGDRLLSRLVEVDDHRGFPYDRLTLVDDRDDLERFSILDVFRGWERHPCLPGCDARPTPLLQLDLTEEFAK